MQLFAKTSIDFVGKRFYAYAFSALLLGAGAVSLWVKGGPHLGIDFTGGTVVQLEFKKTIPMEDLRKALQEKGWAVELQNVEGGEGVIVRVPKGQMDADELSKSMRDFIGQQFPGSDPLIERAEFVGPAVGRALSAQAAKALFWSLVLIIVYVAFRFRSWTWGFCSIAALAHDVFSVIGIFSMLNKEITVTVVAGILTLAGYSINDTIVIYDRMRENLRLSRKESLRDIINRSINETLSRTIMTSVTVALTLIVLFFFGGEVIHDFSFAMLYGVFVGSYSTIFIAAPMIYEWQSKNAPVSTMPIKGKAPGR